MNKELELKIENIAKKHSLEKEKIENIIISSSVEEKVSKILEYKGEICDDLFSIILPELKKEDFIRLFEYLSDSRMLSSSIYIKYPIKYILDIFEQKDKEYFFKDKEYYKKILSYMTIILYYQRDYEGIDYCYQKFVELNNREVNKESMIVYHYEGLVLHQKRYYYDAIRFYEYSLNCAEELGEESYKGRIYDCLGRAFGDKGLFKQAFQYYELSIENKEKMNDFEGLAITLGNKGRLHISTGEYNKALECFKQDLDISKKTNDIIGQVIMTSQIGEMLWIGHKYEKALRFYEKSKALAEKHSNIIGVGYALIGFANCYLDMKEFDNFKECLSQVKKEFEGQKGFVQVLMGTYYKLYGKYYERENDYDKAEENYKKCLEVASDRMSLVDRGLVNERLSVMYLKKNNKKEFRRYLDKAIQLFEETNAFKHLKRVQDRLKDADLEAWLLYVFKGFVGKEVIEQVLSGKTIAENVGENRYATVLFSDIRDFTSFSEKIKAEDLVETLNDYLDVMTKVIEANKGEIDKYIGDAIMALYNPVKVTETESALNSLYSAWRMIEELHLFNRVLKDKKKTPLRIGIGIHSGNIIVGTMGSSSRRNFTAIGDVVNTSSRIEGLTKKYGINILLSENTYNLCKDNDKLYFREIDKVRAKGKDKPVVIYELFYLGEKIPERKKEIYDEYNKAYNQYLNRNFKEALNGFINLSEKFEDPYTMRLYDTYMDRCLEYIKTPPPPDWDGVTTMKEK